MKVYEYHPLQFYQIIKRLSKYKEEKINKEKGFFILYLKIALLSHTKIFLTLNYLIELTLYLLLEYQFCFRFCWLLDACVETSYDPLPRTLWPFQVGSHSILFALFISLFPNIFLSLIDFLYISLFHTHIQTLTNRHS